MDLPRLFLFGPPRLQIAGTTMALERRAAFALLAILALERNPCPRETLLALLWPETNPEQARKQLRNTLYELNRSPLAGIITAGRQNVLLSTHSIRIDALEFRTCYSLFSSNHPSSGSLSASNRDRIESAIALHSAPFMNGYSLRDTVEFEHWVTGQVARFQTEQIHLLNLLIDDYYNRGHFDRAIRHARSLLALDQANEKAHRTVMSILWQTGRGADSIRQFEACREALRDEAGLSPSHETMALLSRIQSQTTPPRRVYNRRYTLPSSVTPFFGRKIELDHLIGMLSNPTIRLLTLTGPGGSGKTRLALEAGLRVEQQYSDGAVWINLAPVTSPEFILSAIEDALDLHTPRIRDALRPKHLLLIIDNADHLVEGLAFLPELLLSAPDLRVLITSRERLNLQAEHVYELAGMQCDAIPFFNLVAHRNSSQSETTRFNPDAVGRVCSLVGGNPLAIELAASWINVLSCDEIAKEIERSLGFLISRRQDSPERHRSLRAVFDHSWNLLNPGDRIILSRLAVMRGGCTLDSARSVSGIDLQDLARLIDKSLVRKAADNRFEIHEIIRQFAWDRLKSDREECDRAERVHAEYFLGLVQSLSDDLKGARQKAALRALVAEIDNIRLAWRWAIEHETLGTLDACLLPLFIFFDLGSRNMDGCALFGAGWHAIGESPLSDERRRIDAMCRAFDGWFQRFSSETNALSLLNQALNRLSPEQDPAQWAVVFDLYSFIGSNEPIPDHLDRLRRVDAIFRSRRDDWGVAMNLEAIGAHLYEQGDWPDAHRAIEESLSIRRRIGDEWGIAMSLEMLGRFFEDASDDEQAGRYYRDSLDLRRRIDADFGGMINCLQGLGRVAMRSGEATLARTLYEEALTLAHETVNPQRIKEISVRLTELNRTIRDASRT